MNIPPPPPPYPQGQPQPPEQLIRTYVLTGWGNTAQKKFQKDAEKLAKEGWRVQTMNSTSNQFNPRNIAITVVYTR
jgi:hypothetical protein